MEVNEERRIVAQTQVGKLMVSTVFLALDHNYFGGPPILWETMVFGDDEGDPADWHSFQCRYASRAAAEKGHAAVVDELKHGPILMVDESRLV